MVEPSNPEAQPGSEMESPDVTPSPDTAADEPEVCYGYDDDVDDYLLENLNDYCPGGLHPVIPGDRLGDNGRFRVVHKLGQGGFGIVWLCHDSVTNKWRAVKVMAAEASTPDCADLRAIELFKGIGLDVLEANHIQLPIDFFWIDGPNGRHLCSVLPLLGGNLLPLWFMYAPLADMLKDICYQMVKAMQFMHSRGLCHGDFRPDNILLRLADGVDEMPEEELIRVLGEPELVPVVQISPVPGDPDGVEYTPVSELNQPGIPVPKYLVHPKAISHTTGLCSTRIAVIDFGVSYQAATTQTKRTGIPFQYGAPEDIFGQSQLLGFASDVWSLGCSISEVYFGTNPFADETEHKFDAVKRMEYCQGPLPQPYRTVWKSWNGDFVNTPCQEVVCYRTHDDGGTSKYVRKDYDESWQDETVYTCLSPADIERSVKLRMEHNGAREFLKWRIRCSHHTDLLPSEVEPLKATWNANRKQLPARTPIENEAATKRGYSLANDYYWSSRNGEDADQLFDLLRNIFKWDPKDRTTVGWIAKHEWFGKRNRRLSKTQRKKSAAASRGRPAGKRRSAALPKRNTSAIPEAGEPYRPGQNGGGGK